MRLEYTLDYELETIKNGIEEGILKESYINNMESYMTINLKKIQELKEEIETLMEYNKEFQELIDRVKEL